MRQTGLWIILLPALLAAGCNSGQLTAIEAQVTAAQARVTAVQEMVTAAQATRNAAATAIAAMPAGAERDAAERALAATDQGIARSTLVLAQARQTLTGAELAVEGIKNQDALTGVGQAIQTVSPLLPGPWGAVAGAAGALLTLVGGWISGRKKGEAAAASLARSLEVAKREDAVFKTAFAGVKDIVRSYQSPAAARIVDSVQGKG